MKHVIIVNPAAGHGNNEKYGYRIQKLLGKYAISSEIFLSKYAGHITEFVKAKSNVEDCRFYCVGGDGTLNEVVTGIVGTNSEIVVVPSGTGNDFVRSLYSEHRSMRKIILDSLSKKATPVDVLKIGKDKYCVNILSAGFDSMVAKNVDKFRRFPFISGSVKYNLAIMLTLLSNKNFRFKMRIDKTTVIKQNFTLIAIANGRFYGGGVCPCPTADIKDGIVNVCAIDSTNLFVKLILLPYYKKGQHTELKQVHLYDSKEITIVAKKKFPANVDGEVFYTNRLNIKVIPGAINVIY